MELSSDAKKIMERFKLDELNVGHGYPTGVFYGKNPNKALETLSELQKNGLLEPKDKSEFFWILTNKGKKYIDSLIIE